MDKLKQLTLTAMVLLAATAAQAQAIPDLLAPATYLTGGSSSLIVVADFNGDGISDVATVEAATEGFLSR